MNPALSLSLRHSLLLTLVPSMVTAFVIPSPVLSHRNGGNAAEAAYCTNLLNLANCAISSLDAGTAKTAATTEFPGTEHNGIGDAFRHCYWSALMTRHMSAEQAKIFGDLHENGDLTEPKRERKMDLANNASGRAFGVAGGSDSETYDLCYSAAAAGKLVTLCDKEDPRCTLS